MDDEKTDGLHHRFFAFRGEKEKIKKKKEREIRGNQSRTLFVFL